LEVKALLIIDNSMHLGMINREEGVCLIVTLSKVKDTGQEVALVSEVVPAKHLKVYQMFQAKAN
jgi:hypothetical protein